MDSEALSSAIKGHDILISALGIDWSTPETYRHFVDVSRSEIAAAKKARVRRLIVVGGAGSLELAPGIQLVDTPQFSDEWRAGANEQSKSLEVFRDENELEWTFFSPAVIIGTGSVQASSGLEKTTLYLR